MKKIKTWLPLVALMFIASQPGQALGNYCEWRLGTGPFTFNRDLGTIHVPRDALFGRLLGKEENEQFTPAEPRISLDCWNDGSGNWTFTFDALQQPVSVPGLEGPVLRTNVPGIGARIRIGNPFNNLNPSHFVPIGTPWVPFMAYNNRKGGIGELNFTHLSHRITLVKIGEVPLGVHTLDTPLFSGHLDGAGIGNVFTYYLKGQVSNTECSLDGNTVSANPVALGEWSTADFTHPGFSTRPTDFQITLSACQVDPERPTFATIELSGANGSAPIGPPGDGVFSLSHGSEAKGVGIRLLGKDGNPMPLQQEVELVPLSDGTTTLDFAAQLYQTEPSRAVRAGQATGALNFIIRYR